MNSFTDDDQQSQPSGDSRHHGRIAKLQLLFAASFAQFDPAAITGEWSAADLAWLEEIRPQLVEIDAAIAEHAPERPLSEVNQIDLNIMRLVIHEQRSSQTPVKVLVDEAIELAKEFGSENSAKFVNGVLAKILFASEEQKGNHGDS